MRLELTPGGWVHANTDTPVARVSPASGCACCNAVGARLEAGRRDCRQRAATGPTEQFGTQLPASLPIQEPGAILSDPTP